MTARLTRRSTPQITKKYAPKIALQAFGQFGYLIGQMATKALMSVKGPITAKSYNDAVRALKNVKTSMLCKPFYVGKNLAYHIPNNADINVTYKAGAVVSETSASRSSRSTHSSRRRERGRRSSA